MKDKQMINTNKAVIVKFPANSSTMSADIYIPFPVYEIRVKGIDVDWFVDYVTSVFTSTLVNGCPLGSAFAGVVYDASTSTKKLRYLYPTPRDINGSYQFNYQPVDITSVFPCPNYGCVCFTIEFIGYM